MPEGYERLRDALKRQGKSDEDAKQLAAAIWNKHHKDNPVTNKPHKTELERKKEYRPALGTAAGLVGAGTIQTGVGLGTKRAIVDPKGLQGARAMVSVDLNGRVTKTPMDDVANDPKLKYLRDRIEAQGAVLKDSRNPLVPGMAWDRSGRRSVNQKMVSQIEDLTGSTAEKGITIAPAVRAGLKEGVIAHEIGHLEQSKFLRHPVVHGGGKAALTAGSILAPLSSNERHAKTAAIASAGLALPLLASEVDASVRGTRILRKAGVRGIKSLSPGIGLASYGAAAAAPYIAYRIKKSLGGYKEMNAKLEILHELGLAMQVTPGGMLGNTYVKGYQGDDTKGSRTGHGKTAYPQHKGKKKKIKALIEKSKPGGNRANLAFGLQGFNLSCDDTCILLGVGDELVETAEMTLKKRMGQLGVMDSLKTHTQQRRALAAPLFDFPTNPPQPKEGSPWTSDILQWLKKKYTPTPSFVS